jgi:hypothetical protein
MFVRYSINYTQMGCEIMTGDQIPEESSLLHCTVKKSNQVLWKVLKYGMYLAVGILATIFAFYGAVAIYGLVVPGLVCIWQFLTGVPWYIYLSILGIAAIPVYSLLWCITRDLTEEDWKSNAAENLTLAFAAFATLALVLATLALVLATLDAVDPVDHITIWYYIFRFPGAVWHHYRKKGVR